jgi:hypothetical protein
MLICLLMNTRPGIDCRPTVQGYQTTDVEFVQGISTHENRHRFSDSNNSRLHVAVFAVTQCRLRVEAV